MALMAPGAYLWITYQFQAAATAPDGTSVANDIWPGIACALILASLTACSTAQATLVGQITVRGVSGSTMTTTISNVVQLSALAFFGGLAIVYRFTNPDAAVARTFHDAWDVVSPHSAYRQRRRADGSIHLSRNRGDVGRAERGLRSRGGPPAGS